jgi:hypothetical protein
MANDDVVEGVEALWVSLAPWRLTLASLLLDVSMVVTVVVGVVEGNPHRDDAVIVAIRVSEVETKRSVGRSTPGRQNNGCRIFRLRSNLHPSRFVGAEVSGGAKRDV